MSNNELTPNDSQQNTSLQIPVATKQASIQLPASTEAPESQLVPQRYYARQQPSLFSCEQAIAGASAPSFYLPVEFKDVFSCEKELENTVLGSPEAQEFISNYLGYKLEWFEPQVIVSQHVSMTADIVAFRPGDTKPAAVIELSDNPIDTDHVQRTQNYARLLGAADAVLIAPAFSKNIRSFIEELQALDRNGVTLHMIRVDALTATDNSGPGFTFEALTPMRIRNPLTADLEDIVRKAHRQGDHTLRLDSIQTQKTRARIESGYGLGTHSFIRIDSHQNHSRISINIKNRDLKTQVSQLWPGAFLDAQFYELDGFEGGRFRSSDRVQVAAYSFFVNDPQARERYHEAVATAYITLRNLLSHTLVTVTGQAATKRVLPFLGTTATLQTNRPIHARQSTTPRNGPNDVLISRRLD